MRTRRLTLGLAAATATALLALPAGPAPADPPSAAEPTGSTAGSITDQPTAPQPTLEPGPVAQPTTGPTTGPTTPTTGPTTAAAGRDTRPNIVFISTDDQAELEMRWIPRTRRLLGGRGVTFTDSIAPHPLCCPARAIMLTGQYAQNNGVRHNTGVYGGFQALDSKHTLPVWLNRAGYQTAFIGKYLNGYTANDGAEPGWDVWNPTVHGVYSYYGFTQYNNGNPRRYESTHNADLIGAKTADYIRRFARSNRPFYVWASHVGPHGACSTQDRGCWVSAIPAHRHADMFSRTRLPTRLEPSFNEMHVADKPAFVRDRAGVRLRHATSTFRQRIRSLQAVDGVGGPDRPGAAGHRRAGQHPDRVHLRQRVPVR